MSDETPPQAGAVSETPQISARQRPARPLSAQRLREGAVSQPHFGQPVRQVVLMLIVLTLVAVGGWFAYGRILPIFAANPWLNGLILGVFVLGVLACFWQLAQLMQSVSWIERFAERRRNAADKGVAAIGAGDDNAPRLLAPLAALLGPRGPAGGVISTGSARSILDSVATRIDEARDITRYLANLLIFLGLLGTFYGLATTVPAVVDTIRALAPQEGESGIQVFEKLMTGLEAQLGGMAVAFSSSLLGLAGSLVVGLLELFATHGQNRFYRELEEWLSGFTRLAMAGEEGEQLDQAAILGLFDQIGGQMAVFQDFYTERDEIREQEAIEVDQRVVLMTRNLDQIGQMLASEAERGRENIEAVVQGMTRLNAGQDRLDQTLAAIPAVPPELTAALTRLAEGQDRLAALGERAAAGTDELNRALGDLAEGQEWLIRRAEAAVRTDAAEDEIRHHLRAISEATGRLVEDAAAARQAPAPIPAALPGTDALRREIAELTEALRALGQS